MVTESKTSQFTRGPWRAVFGPGSNRDFSIFGSDGRKLVESAQTHKADGVSVEQVLADARLMEIAPAMYYALEQLDEGWSKDLGDPESELAQKQFTNRAIEIWRLIRAARAMVEG